MARPHPLGITSPDDMPNPEWAKAEAKRHALRVADRKRRIVWENPPLIDRLRRWLLEFVP